MLTNVVCPVRFASVLTSQTIQDVMQPVKILLAATDVLALADIVWPSLENALVSLEDIVQSCSPPRSLKLQIWVEQS